MNNVSKVTEVTFSSNEAITLSSAFVTFTQGATVYLETPIAQVDITKLVVNVPAGTFDEGIAPIVVTATFVDGAANTTDFTGQIVVDTIAPAAVTGLVATTDAAGHVTLTWTNPTVGTYTGLRVVRVGDFTATLLVSATTFTDLTTEKGKTYQYVVVVADDAGNETNTPQLTVAVPAAEVVAAAVSDSTDYSVPETNTNKEEVKADTSTNETPAATNEDSGFPAWGIMVLLVLAAVGGYLIWSQKPEPVVAPVAPKKKSSPSAGSGSSTKKK